MREYFKRLKTRPGINIAVMITVLAAIVISTGVAYEPFYEAHVWGLFGLIFVCVYYWLIILISNISWIYYIKNNASTKISLSSPVKEKSIEIWEPVPGYEKYYVQNTEGKVKSLGKEFDFSIESGSSEEMSAWLTMKFLKGYYRKDSTQSYNIDKVIEVMEKNRFNNRTK